MTTPASDRCRALLEQLSKYIDDELTPAERRALTAHRAGARVVRPWLTASSTPSTPAGRRGLQAARRRPPAGAGPHRHAARLRTHSPDSYVV